MKNLFYKELKLSMHPLVWVFVIVFPLLSLIPSYPKFVTFIYVATSYPILFLGANKGVQSNDILYSSILPVSRKDIVKARLLTVLMLQTISIVLFLVLVPLSLRIENSIAATGGEIPNVGLGNAEFISMIAFALVSYAILDIIFFARFYSNGRAVTSSFLLGALAFIIFLCLTTIILPLASEGYKLFFAKSYPIQLIYLGVGLLLSALLHFLAYKIGVKKFSKVDL